MQHRNEWIEITVKYPNKCFTCKDLIKKDQTALWSKGVGIKHIECPKVRTQPISISVSHGNLYACHGWYTKYDWKVEKPLATNSVNCSNARCHICNKRFFENTSISWHPEQFKGCHKECRGRTSGLNQKTEENVKLRLNVSPEEAEQFQQKYESETLDGYKKRTGYV